MSIAQGIPRMPSGQGYKNAPDERVRTVPYFITLHPPAYRSSRVWKMRSTMTSLFLISYRISYLATRTRLTSRSPKRASCSPRRGCAGILSMRLTIARAARAAAPGLTGSKKSYSRRRSA